MSTHLIGDKIRRARFARGKLWTQKKLAEQAGLSQGYISAIERGEEFPSLKALTRISEVLDWPLSFFIDGEGAFEDHEAAAPTATVDSTDGLPAAQNNLAARDSQLRQALQTIIRAGLESQLQAIQFQHQENLNELTIRIQALEARLSDLEGGHRPLPASDRPAGHTVQ